MTISMRLSETECAKLNEMKQTTGLSTTALIKKCLFDNNGSQYCNKNILTALGRISTSVNLTKRAVNDNNLSLAKEQIDIIENGVMLLWQCL